jgi:ribonuclease BN (tRNA processing enzyme)
MQILFLGTGSAYTLGGDNFQSNMVLTANNGRRLLIDCGTDIRWSLAKQRLSYLDITDIYISHLHADHAGGLEYIGFSRKFDPRCSRPRLYLESSLVEPLWDHSLRGGMGLISGSETTLETFFDVHPVVAQRPFEWEGARLEAVSTIHVSGPSKTMHSYGLLIGEGEHRTLLTTDTRYTPGHLSAPYASAGLIFHDCETGNIKTGVHAHYDDLVYLPPAVRAKTWLYGYQPGALPDAVADGFRGFIQPGQSFELEGPARGFRASQEEKCDA